VRGKGRTNQFGDAMVAASIEAGIPVNPDFNGARQEGVGYYQTTTTNCRRWKRCIIVRPLSL
jgi:choline dehydrogenase